MCRLNAPTEKTYRRIHRLIFVAALVVTLLVPTKGSAEKISFHIPSQRADIAITELARQAGVTLIFPFDVLTELTSNELIGEFELAEAAALLLNGTGLTLAVVENGQQLIVNTRNDQGKSAATTSPLPERLAASTPDPEVAQRMQSRIEEVFVTAQKVERNLQSIPISIAALRADQLADLGVNHAQATDHFIPNFQLDTATSSGGTSATISVRGVGTFRRQVSGQNTVAVYVDEVFLPGSEANMLNLLDIERIEVLRGPQGTLFGRNAIGGAIHYISRRPELNRTFGTVRATAGETGRSDIDMTLNAPLTDRSAARLAISKRNADGYITSRLDGRELGASTSTGLRASLTLDASETLSLDFVLERLESEQNGEITVYQMDQNFLDRTLTGGAWIGGGPGGRAGGGATGGFRPWVNAGAGSFDMDSSSPTFATIAGLTGGQCEPIGHTAPCTFSFDMFDLASKKYSTPGTDALDISDLVISGTSIRADWSISESLMIHFVGGYRESSLERSFDGDGTPFAVRFGRNLIDTKSASHELQLYWAGERVDFIGGVYFYDEDHVSDVSLSQFGNLWYDDSCVLDYDGIAYNYVGCIANEYTADGAPRSTLSFIDTTSHAAYFNVEVSLSGIFDLVLGGRYTDDEQNLRQLARTGFSSDGLSGTTFTEDIFTPRVILSAQITETLFSYISYSQGYRQGGINTALATDSDGVFIDALAPPFFSETNSAIEIGFKSEFWDRRIRLNAAYFRYDYEDLQTTATPPGGQFAPFEQNAADVKVDGLEIDLIAALGNRWSVTSSVGTLDAAYETIGTIATQIALESHLPRAPELSYTVGVQYERRTARGRWLASINYGFTDEQYSTPQDFNDLPNNPSGTGRFDFLCTEVIPSLDRGNGCNGNQGLMPSYGIVSTRLQFDHVAETWTAGLYCRNCLDEYYLIGLSQFGQQEPLSEPFLFNQINPARPREIGVDFQYRFGES